MTTSRGGCIDGSDDSDGDVTPILLRTIMGTTSGTTVTTIPLVTIS